MDLFIFETGEAVSALSEWIISKNIMPEHNIASEYIAKLQAEPAKLDMINQTIKKSTARSNAAREGNEDVAAIQLKKILSQNPKLIKGYHLLALIHIKKEEYEKARKILKKAARIDKTNSTTLRFLKKSTSRQEHRLLWKPRRFARRGKAEEDVEKVLTDRLAASDAVIQPPTFRESSYMATLLNIFLGLVLGGLVVWFLIGPGHEQNITREADEKIIEYTATMASQEAQISELQSQVDALNETTASAQQQVDAANQKTTSYENLMKAVDAYQQGNTSQTSNALMEVNTDNLSVEAKAVYDEIYEDIQDDMFNELKDEGVEAFDNAEYTTAIDRLTKAREINAQDYVVLNRLAHAYRETGGHGQCDRDFPGDHQCIPLERNALQERQVRSNSWVARRRIRKQEILRRRILRKETPQQMRKVRAKGRAVTRTVKKRNKKIIKQRETSKPGDIWRTVFIYLRLSFLFGSISEGEKNMKMRNYFRSKEAY